MPQICSHPSRPLRISLSRRQQQNNSQKHVHQSRPIGQGNLRIIANLLTGPLREPAPAPNTPKARNGRLFSFGLVCALPLPGGGTRGTGPWEDGWLALGNTMSNNLHSHTEKHCVRYAPCARAYNKSIVILRTYTLTVKLCGSCSVWYLGLRFVCNSFELDTVCPPCFCFVAEKRPRIIARPLNCARCTVPATRRSVAGRSGGKLIMQKGD